MGRAVERRGDERERSMVDAESVEVEGSAGMGPHGVEAPAYLEDHMILSRGPFDPLLR